MRLWPSLLRTTALAALRAGVLSVEEPVSAIRVEGVGHASLYSGRSHPEPFKTTRVGHGPTAPQRHERRKTAENCVLASFAVTSGFGRQVGRAIDPLIGGQPHVIGGRGLGRPRGWGSTGGAWACVRGAFGPLSLV